MRKDKSLFNEVFSSSSLGSPVDRFFRKTNMFSDFRFEDKINQLFKLFWGEFLWDGCYKVLNAKVETYSAFFLAAILFTLMKIGKSFCTTQNFLKPE